MGTVEPCAPSQRSFRSPTHHMELKCLCFSHSSYAFGEDTWSVGCLLACLLTAHLRSFGGHDSSTFTHWLEAVLPKQ